jgi:hypothetical protein
VDAAAPAGTYDPEIVVSIDYETAKDGGGGGDNDRDEKDPTTFLERSIEVGGEFLTFGPQNTSTAEAALGDDPSPEAGEDSPGVWENQQQQGDQQQQQDPSVDNTVFPVSPTDLKATADPNLGIVKFIPTAELSYHWPLVIRPPWGRIFGYLGAVNGSTRGSSGKVHPGILSAHNRLFFNLEPETIVYQGISAKQTFLWNGSSVVAQPWDLTYKFSVKRVVDAGKVYGWNHVWVPNDQKWKKLYRHVSGGRHELYKQRNLLNLFLGGTAADAVSSS